MSDVAESRTRANRTYWLLVLALASVSALTVLLTGSTAGEPGQALPASPPVMALVSFVGLTAVYGGLGYLGLTGIRAAGLPGIWAPGVTTRQRFLLPAAAGAAFGLGFIALDLLLAPYNGFGPLPHPEFPTSVAASITAGIGEELIFRVLLVGGGFWLLTQLVDTESAREGAFWAVALFSAAAFTAAHVPGIAYLVGQGDPAATLSPVLLLELFLLNGSLSVAAAEMLRRFGPLAPIGLHLWTDMVWHVIYGGLQ